MRSKTRPHPGDAGFYEPSELTSFKCHTAVVIGYYVSHRRCTRRLIPATEA